MVSQTYHQLLKKIRQELSLNSNAVEQGRVIPESEIILAEAIYRETGKELSRFEIFSNPTAHVTDATKELALKWSIERSQGKLLQHITQSAFFFGKRYFVNSSVLAPRPETEMLVHVASEWIKSNRPMSGLEIGVGSGVITIELLTRFSFLNMVATELEPAALEVAKLNFESHLSLQAARVSWVPIDHTKKVLEPFLAQGAINKHSFDFIISNPPYLDFAQSSLEVDSEVLQQESHSALFAPAGQPLYFYEKIIEGAAEILSFSGYLFFEIPHERATDIEDLLKIRGWTHTLYPDLNNQMRVVKATRRQDG